MEISDIPIFPRISWRSSVSRSCSPSRVQLGNLVNSGPQPKPFSSFRQFKNKPANSLLQAI
jgi:hypothetical protein